MYNRSHENISPTATMEVMFHLTPLHLKVRDCEGRCAALFRMAKNGVGGGLLVSRRAWTSLSKSIPHLIDVSER